MGASQCRRFAALGALLVATTSGASAAADPAPRLPSAASPAEEVWYGAPMLVIDGIALSLVAVGTSLLAQNLCFLPCDASRSQAAGDGATLAFVGLSGFVLGPPIVHFTRGHVDRGFGSMIVRFLTPPLGVLLGAALSGACGGDTGSCRGAMMGAVAGGGVLGLVVVDDVLLARDVPATQPSASSFIFAPQLGVGRTTALGLGGVF